MVEVVEELGNTEVELVVGDFGLVEPEAAFEEGFGPKVAK